MTAPRAAGPLDHLQSLNAPDHHLLTSETLGRPFHIFVRLPEGYAEGDARYPAVYLLDGGAMFPMLASYYSYLAFGEEAPALIVVGISYGNDDWGTGNFRSTDFTAPAADRAEYGGAAKFQTMLETELLPLVEGRYRADPARRIVFGQSLGGQFVLYTALTKPSLFWGHIASNPALHRNLPFFLEFQGDASASDSRLFVASGTEDYPLFREPALEWIEHWKAQGDTPWRLETLDLEGASHFSAAPEAFRTGVKWLFEAR